MSFEEEDSGPTLKELVTKNLEVNGILGKIQAQLRASVFLTLEDEMKRKEIPLINKKTQQLLSTQLGKLAISIIQDFLQCLNLEFTLAVFNPETNILSTDNIPNRTSLFKILEPTEENAKEDYPFLFQLLEESQVLKKQENFINKVSNVQNISRVCSTVQNNICTIDNTNTKNPASPAYLIDSKEKEHDNHDAPDILTNSSEKQDATMENKSKCNNTSKHLTMLPTSISTSKTDSKLLLQSKTFNEKDPLTSIENQYNDEEFSSTSNTKESTLNGSVQEEKISQLDKPFNERMNKDDEKQETDENTEEDIPDEIEEEIPTEDVTSSCSAVSNETIDISVSQAASMCDYQESLQQ